MNITAASKVPMEPGPDGRKTIDNVTKINITIDSITERFSKPVIEYEIIIILNK